MFDIAICDDSELDRGLLIEEIGKCEKYRETVRFHQYSSGKELLAAMELARFSLIFLDIQMQGMDGERTAEEIRKMDDSVVLVFYTGFAEPTPHSFEVQPYRFKKAGIFWLHWTGWQSWIWDRSLKQSSMEEDCS